METSRYRRGRSNMRPSRSLSSIPPKKLQSRQSHPHEFQTFEDCRMPIGCRCSVNLTMARFAAPCSCHASFRDAPAWLFRNVVVLSMAQRKAKTRITASCAISDLQGSVHSIQYSDCLLQEEVLSVCHGPGICHKIAMRNYPQDAS